VVVNYTYYLRKPFEEYQKHLLHYSILNSLEIGEVVFHCNQSFIPILEEINLPVKIELLPELRLNTSTYWAAYKIYVYNKCPIGEIHLDVDAIIKDFNYNFLNYDLQIAYYDEVKNKPTCFEVDKDYKLPKYIIPDTDGFNMSYVIFNNNSLKNLYCKEALNFMYKNNIQDYGWKTMVFVEQSFLFQIVKFFNYSYNYFSDGENYYHLGASKSFYSEEDKQLLINKLKIKINEFSNKILC
jgi:hypothetical protein